MNLIISTSVNSALPMPIFCFFETKISLGFHLVFVKAYKNFIDFIQDKFNGFAVDASWNHISISKNSMRFWKSHIVLYDKGTRKTFILYAGVNSSTGQALPSVAGLPQRGFLDPTL